MHNWLRIQLWAQLLCLEIQNRVTQDNKESEDDKEVPAGRAAYSSGLPQTTDRQQTGQGPSEPFSCVNGYAGANLEASQGP